MISQAVEDYLKTIYTLEQAGEVTTSAIAEKMGVSAASVTNMVKKLAELKLLRYSPYHGVHLTRMGEKVALEVIRHHRLLELYLTEALGYSLDKVHDEAEKLEHSISEEFEEKIDELLGRPTTDPHGDPIPTKEGIVAKTPHKRLSELELGELAVISRMSNQDPEQLRYLASLGLVPKVSVVVLEKAPFKGPLRVKVGNSEQFIGWEMAHSIFTTRHPKGEKS